MSIIQKNRVFRFAASVRLAILLMALLLIAAAIGTVLESQYNAQVAATRVYHSLWFLLLLGMLWVNIFSATLARYPFKKNHIGFVITHIGLLTLLIGGMTTATLGIDGQLRIIQGSSDNEVFLQNLVVRVEDERGQIARVPFARVLKPLRGGELDALNESVASGFTIDEYQPFVSVERGIARQAGDAKSWAIQFAMKSRFFDVEEWLNSRDRAEMQMGPATIRLIVNNAKTDAPAKINKTRRTVAGASLLRAKEAKSGRVLAEIPISLLRKAPQQVGPAQITLSHQYEEAAVAGKGKIEDRGTPGKNPALELKIEHQGQATREVIFARYPGFSLQPNGIFGMRFEYVSGHAELVKADTDVHTGAAGLESAADVTYPKIGNLIEFHVSPNGQGAASVEVELYKNGAPVLKRSAKEGIPIQTPWMGMLLTLKSATHGGQEIEQVKPIELPVRSQMPPSAIRVRIPGQSQEETWVVEGERRPIMTPTGTRFIYFGPDSIHLPYQIALNQFSKVDYPGTETALSYQSQVQVDGQGEEIVISMNEPLKRAGYTLYQSSYVLEKGRPPISVFSVNQDPGRFIKYAGSLILIVGIALFTIMRSSWYLGSRRPKEAIA